jgi:glycosyltransferase involved in cell wall biosynthesis
VNITHVVENLNRGGLERVVIDLVVEQQRAGHACQVVCLFEKGLLAVEIERHGVPVLSCDKRVGPDLRAIRRLRDSLRRHRTEVLHSHNMIAHYHAVPASLGLPIRHVLNTRHGMGALRAASRREWLYRRCMSRTDHVVTVCERARDDLVARRMAPEGKLVVVPNGIEVTRFAAASDETRAALARELGAAPSARIVGTVGRLNWAKDLTTLIRAYALVRERVPDSVLAIVGDGADRDKLAASAEEAGVASFVRFLGDRGDVAALLRGFDVFAMSSVSEGYSIALLEACASALPIVATDVGGNAEIVRDGRNGRIVPPRDASALAQAIVEMLADPRRAAAMGLAGREWALDEASLRSMTSRYLALYAQGASA